MARPVSLAVLDTLQYHDWAAHRGNAPAQEWFCFRCGTQFSSGKEHELCGQRVIWRLPWPG